MRVRLRNGYTRAYAQIMQHTHTHKAVSGRVEVKKLLSRRRQSNYSNQFLSNLTQLLNCCTRTIVHLIHSLTDYTHSTFIGHKRLIKFTVNYGQPKALADNQKLQPYRLWAAFEIVVVRSPQTPKSAPDNHKILLKLSGGQPKVYIQKSLF